MSRPPVLSDLDSFILGDNAFFGVDHRSRTAGEEKAKRFQDTGEIIRVFKTAKRHGARGVMLSSYDRVPEIIRSMLDDGELGRDFHIYPNIPYLIKHVQRVTREGMVGALAKTLLPSGAIRASSILRVITAWLRKDPMRIFGSVLDMEIAAYRGAEIPAIFLHNGITDLILGLEMDSLFTFFDEHIRKRYRATPGFGTLNLPRLVGRLHSAGLRNPLIMAPFNARGFHMNPDAASCEEAVRSGGFTLLAMNVLASGAARPSEAFEYLGRFKNIRHVVVGATSERHISECCALSRQHLAI